ncbi:hypothetical protein LINPERPRIM_LOCUS26433 [Linum perenne]
MWSRVRRWTDWRLRNRSWHSGPPVRCGIGCRLRSWLWLWLWRWEGRSS